MQDLPPLETLSIPWFHNVVLIHKIKDPATRLWYAKQASQNGWSRNILTLQIESDLHKRHGKAITNFKQTLPDPQSDLAQQIIKDLSKMNFYLNVVDDKMRHTDDQPSIGIILCQDRKGLVAEYALRGMTKAIGVSEYQLTRKLPKKLKGSLPTIEEIEKELGKS